MDNTVTMVEGPDSGKSNDAVTSKTDVQKKKGKEEKQPTKIVIRKLPGTMTEESFVQHVSPLFEHDYFCFVQAENPSFGEHNYSRAYINFLKVEDVFTFTSKFDEYVFIDDYGQEFPAIVEFAPFQRIPKNRNRRNDSLCGTIEEDPEYQKFLKELESEENDHKPNQITEHYFDLANDENEEKVTSTPLIEYLTSKKNDWMRHKEEKREERRRRDLERRKLKEENKRVKRENRELEKKAAVEKQREERRKEGEGKAAEEVKMISTDRVKGKSYQEERQRDLARRKMEEKGAKGDSKDNNDGLSETEKAENQVAAIEIKSRRKSDEYKEEGKRRRSYEEKRSSRDDDRKSSSSSFQRGEKEDRKSYSYGSKKREYSSNYEYDNQYKSKTSGGHYYDDYKSKSSHSSYQKNSYTNKYGSVKSKDYDEKAAKRYETKSKKADSDSKESKKSHQWEKEEKKTKSSDEVKKEFSMKNDDNEKDCKSSNFEKSAKMEDKRDDRAERRIKNKDRPAMEIYRPGMGKFSRQRLERNKSTESRDDD